MIWNSADLVGNGSFCETTTSWKVLSKLGDEIDKKMEDWRHVFGAHENKLEEQGYANHVQ